MSLRIEYDERAISLAAAFLGDPQGLREVLDAIDRLADDPIRPAVIGDGGDFVSFAGEYHLARRPTSSRSRALILPGRAIFVVRRESLSATVSPVVHSIPEDDWVSIPEDDWVSAEAEALLDATPGLREDLRAAMDELHAGTLQTVDAATARARIEARIKSRGSS